MIELKPNNYRAFDCPACASGNVDVCETVFQGIHVLADCRCMDCDLEFYHDYPTGNARHYPTVFGKHESKLYAGELVPWYSKPLLSSFKNKCNDAVSIEKRVYKQCDDVVILNCLDFLYGHVLLKLLNAQYYIEKRQDLGLVIIIPKSFEWLIPTGIAEVWLVDINIYKNSQNWFIELNRFVSSALQEYTTVFLSMAFSEPDFAEIDISAFTKTRRFELSNFYNTKPTISFIARKDRLWFGSYAEKLLYRIFRKLNMLKLVGNVFLKRQNKRIEKTFDSIRKAIPDAECNVVGMYESGGFDQSIIDCRSSYLNEDIERKWCEIYSRSHVVIGIHGSNMIIPTALSAGFIEILPKDRFGNIVQDIGSPYRDRSLLFLGRFAREYARPGEIADVAASIFRDYEGFNLYMGPDNLKHGLYCDARKFRAN